MAGVDKRHQCWGCELICNRFDDKHRIRLDNLARGTQEAPLATSDWTGCKRASACLRVRRVFGSFSVALDPGTPVALTVALVGVLAAAPAGASEGTPAPSKLDKVAVRSEPGSGEERFVAAGKLVLGRRLLERSNASSVREVLLRDPAVSVSANGRIGLLGLPGYTEVLLDGEPPPPGLNPLGLPPAQVERIEIIRGASADLSLGAIAGSINVVRRAQRRPVPLEGSAEVSLPAFSQSIRASAQTIRKDEASGDTLSFAVNGARNRTVAHSAVQEWVGDSNAGPAWRRHSRNQGRQDDLNLSLRVGLKLGAAGTLGLATNLVTAEVGTTAVAEGMPGDGTAYTLLRPTHTVSRWRWRTSPSVSQSLDWERPAEQGGVWQLRAVASCDKGLWETSGESRWGEASMQALMNRASSERRSGSLRLVRRGWVKGDHKLQAGAEAQLERKAEERTNADGVTASFIDDLYSSTAVGHSRDLGAWLQDEWAWSEDLSLKLGLRGVSRAHRLDEGAGSARVKLNLWAPSLNLRWMPGEEGNHALSLGLSRGFKLPQAQQLSVRPWLDPTTPCTSRDACSGSRPQAPDRVGNPALQPERSWGLDLNLESNVREHSAVSLGFALRWIDQLVGEATRQESVPWSADPRWVARPANLGRARSQGLSLGFSLMPRDWWAEAPPSIELTGALQWARSKISTVPGPYNRLPDQAPFSARLGLKGGLQSLPLEWRIDGLLHPGSWWQAAGGMQRWQSVKRAWSIAGTWSFSAKQQLTLKGSNLPGETRLTESIWSNAGLHSREATRTRPEFSLFWISRL